MTENKNSGKSLKGRNLAWLVATLVLDIILLLVIAFHNAIDHLNPTRLALLRLSSTAALPVFALALSLLIPAHWKAVLVFWRIKQPLPGSQAFSVHGPADHRVDIDQLRKNVGEFPTDERNQNAKWYGLYRLVASDPSVADSHKNYLLFRDIAAVSILLVPFALVALFFMGAGRNNIIASISLFVAQYMVAAFAARATGIRFVQNVLAIHASGKGPTS
jgi:hypothetical protein